MLFCFVIVPLFFSVFSFLVGLMLDFLIMVHGFRTAHSQVFDFKLFYHDRRAEIDRSGQSTGRLVLEEN